MGKILNNLFKSYLQIYGCSRRFDLVNRYHDSILALRGDLIGCLENTEYFHGTGAYHYDFKGSKYDGVPNGIRYSLESLLSDGLIPQKDFFNELFETGSEKTTSLSKNRIYARCYAELFMTEGNGLEYSYGSSKFWGKLVAARLIFHELSKDAMMQRHKYLKEKRNTPEYLERKVIYRENIMTMYKGWTRSFRKDGKYEGKNFIFALGAKSDIPENFGIILGIKKDVVSPLPIKYKGVALYEDRTSRHILPTEYSHIQVPLKNLDFVRRELGRIGLDVPVFPIEFVELMNYEAGLVKMSMSHR